MKDKPALELKGIIRLNFLPECCQDFYLIFSCKKQTGLKFETRSKIVPYINMRLHFGVLEAQKVLPADTQTRASREGR